MKRVVVRGRGGPDVLRVEEADSPALRAGQVRVRTEAVGVAFGDLMRRRGLLAPPWAFTPGYDAVGVVTEVGDGVEVQKGARVAVFMPVVGFGGYSTEVVVDAPHAVPVPDTLAAEDALLRGLNYITALHILDMLDLSAGASLLVHGAAGGVGTAMLELGRMRGLRMFGTASAGKHDRVRSYGATPIDYRSQRFEDVVSDLDAVVDPIGGKHLRRSRSVLAPTGRLVAFGVTGDVDKGYVGLVPGLIELARLAPSGQLKLYGVGATHSLARAREAWAQLMDLELSPVVGARIPLAEAARAHQLLEDRAVEGKVVLVP